MCGLAGIICTGPAYKDEVEFFDQLTWVTALRGRDSTGAMALDKAGNTRVFKTLGSVATMRHKLPRDMWLTNSFIRGMMFHHRDATVGDVTIENAHPFETDRYIGAHNGTMRSYEFRSDPNKTDSEILMETIDRDGLMPTLERLRDDNAENAYALTLYDKADSRFILYRNFSRSLFLFKVRGWAGVKMWASEESAIEFIAKRVGAHPEVESVLPYTVYKIDPRTLIVKKYPIGAPSKVEKEKVPIGPPWYDDDWDEPASPKDERGGSSKSKIDWACCDQCGELQYGDSYHRAEKFVRGGKTKIRCVTCSSPH